MSEAGDLLGVVSWNENGFWQADVFESASSSDSPIWFCTGKASDTYQAVAKKMQAEFGNDLKVVTGFYGECEECGLEHIKPIEVCSKCGSPIHVCI